ncbi:hypothetical protein FF38_13927 [Lucilia cuprina]|uniref:Uncharacterized protein n=1 Tax=Lucilia cuprina TaxID=7375 RepID=A0A0L0CFG8_LUCCU|nr:hypothetical protein FF38_13927 [Lucilia cuprina]
MNFAFSTIFTFVNLLLLYFTTVPLNNYSIKISGCDSVVLTQRSYYSRGSLEFICAWEGRKYQFELTTLMPNQNKFRISTTMQQQQIRSHYHRFFAPERLGVQRKRLRIVNSTTQTLYVSLLQQHQH